MTKLLKKSYKDIFIFILPFIIFMFMLLMYYPGIIPYDGNVQWQQVQSKIITNSHPFFSTYFMYLLSKIWNDPKIVILFQMFIFSFFWMIMCKKTRNDNNYYKQSIYTIIISSIPIIGIYSITLWKDVLYSYYLMMLAFLTYQIGSKNNFKTSKLELAFIGILLFLIFSYRHNGVLVVGMYFIIFTILYLINNKKDKKKIVLVFLSFIIFFCIFLIPKNHYLTKSEKVKGEDKESISIGMQNKYITWIFGNYIEEGVVTKKDLKFLNNIMDVNRWEEKYNGYLINGTFTPDEINENYIVNNEKKYHDMFIKYSLKYPNLLIEHYLESDSLLISLNSINKGYVYVYPFTTWKYFTFNGMINSKLPWFENKYTEKINSSLKSPYKYFYQPALILYLSIIITIYLTKKYKQKRLYLLLIPMLLNTISLLPINLAQDLRYVYINYLTLVVLGLICISLKKDTTIMKKMISKKQIKNIENPKILMIIPAYNEEKAILNTVNKIRNYNKDNKTNYDILVINDGSYDKTSEICKKNKIKVIDLIHNLGIGGAVQTGYRYAYENNYDIAIQYDGDGQHEVAYVKKIIQPILNGEANFVIGSRFIKKDKNNFNSTFARRIGINVLSFFMKLTSNQKIYDTTSGFRAVDKNVIKEFANNYPLEYPEPITTVEMIKKGYKVSEISVKMNEREGGSSSIYSWKKAYYMVNVILSILVVGFRRDK